MQRHAPSWIGAALWLLILGQPLEANEVHLEDLIGQALLNNPEIRAAEARAASMRERISQESSLMDPMLSVGYENNGLSSYNYGDSPDAKWMFSLAQTFPFPGKLALQEEAASLEADAQLASAETVRREVVGRLSEAYYDLVLTARELELIREQESLTRRLEETALARYAAGTGAQEEVLAAQAEKYLLRQKEEMARSRRDSLEAMIRRETGSAAAEAIGNPAETRPTPFPYTLEELVEKAETASPEVLMNHKLMRSTEKRLYRSQKEALPDITLMAKYTSKGGEFEDMWELTASVPLPVFYKSRQGAGISEASWSLARARSDLEAARLRVTSAIRDNLAMIRASEHIMQLYRDAFIPKARQDIDAALAAFASGRMDAVMALSRLKAPFDYELIAWQEQVKREKAIARIRVLTGGMEVQE